MTESSREDSSIQAVCKDVVKAMDSVNDPLDATTDPDGAITQQLAQLSLIYGISADDLAMEWSAYSFNNAGTDISLKSLKGLDSVLRRKHTALPAAADARSTPSVYSHPAPPTQPSLDKNSLLSHSEGASLGQVIDAALERPPMNPDAFMSPKAQSRHQRNRPMQTRTRPVFSPNSLASPADGKYNTRKNRLTVASTFNDGLAKAQPARSPAVSLDVDLTLWENQNHFRYMFQPLGRVAQIVEDRLAKNLQLLREQIPDCPPLVPVNLPSQDEVLVGGRIASGSAATLHESEVVLQGDRDISAHAFVPLNLTEMPSFALFEGQSVLVRGFNPTGRMLIAKSIYYSFAAPKMQIDESILREKQEKMENRPMSVLVASGPFTPDDGLCNTPLHDLLNETRSRSPDILILCGPFVNGDHKLLFERPVDPRAMFSEMISSIESILAGVPTRVLLVPSPKDFHHHPIFPQPPFDCSDAEGSKVVFLPNPASFLLNGTLFSVTTSDIVLHIGTSQITKVGENIIANSIVRNAQMLVAQRSFYPLYPPAANSNVDLTHSERFQMRVTPDVLITPSKLHHCARELPDCDSVMVNPGTLVKGISGGTFAHMVIHQGDSFTKFSDRVRVDIVRI